jgi:hypothetical protein
MLGWLISDRPISFRPIQNRLNQSAFFLGWLISSWLTILAPIFLVAKSVGFVTFCFFLDFVLIKIFPEQLSAQMKVNSPLILICLKTWAYGNGLPKVSLGPTMPYPFTPLWARRAGGLRQSLTPLDTPCPAPMSVRQGVSTNSLKFHAGLPCPTLIRPAGGRPAAVFFPLGYPTP